MMDAALAKAAFTEDLYDLPAHVLVVIPGGWETITEANQVLLARILSSVRLSLAAVQVVTAEQFSMKEAALYRPKAILAFGVNFTGAAPLYEVKMIDDAQVVVADAISDLDDVRKKSLWIALKQVFQL